MGEHVGATGKQMVLTTHNPLVLDGLALGNDDVRLFTVDRTEAGATVIRRVLNGGAAEGRGERGDDVGDVAVGAARRRAPGVVSPAVRVGIVCEGSTDFAVLRVLCGELLGTEDCS